MANSACWKGFREGYNSAESVQLDSIKVMNHSRDVDTVLYWPDTTLTLYHVGIPMNPGYRKWIRCNQGLSKPSERLYHDHDPYSGKRQGELNGD